MATIRVLQKEYLPTLASEDFFLLLARALARERIFPLAHPDYALTVDEEARAREYFDRRRHQEPVAYLTGHREFYGRDFSVTPDTLIPRPETELLIERVLQCMTAIETNHPETSFSIIDIGTGSGNIIITLAKETALLHPQSHTTYHASDISRQALTVAQKNANTHAVTDIITFLESDLLNNFSSLSIKESHCIIAANLPYLATAIYAESPADVRDYEPRSALISGVDGLDHYRRLLPTLTLFTRHALSTTIFFEISPEQAPRLSHLIVQSFPQAEISVIRDLSGKKRLIQARV